MSRIYVDADGCPVKEEACRVAARYKLPVFLVANAGMAVPEQPGVELVIVSSTFDAADDHIAEQSTTGDIVITDDIPLAARCLERGALVLSTRGKRFSSDTIGDALATRELMRDLRAMGTVAGGPAPFSDRDRSTFLQKLDEAVHAARKAR